MSLYANYNLIFTMVMQIRSVYYYLVGGLEHDFYDFPFSLELTFIPTDEVIFFRGIGIPPTRLVYLWYIYYL